MGLIFRNRTNSTVDVAYAYYESNCRSKGGVTYIKTGWFPVGPGRSRQVWSGWAGGRTFFFYAESVKGVTWGGNYFTQVPDDPFRWCWNTGCSTCTNVGFGRVDVGTFDFNQYIDLTAIRSQAKPKSGNILVAVPTKLKEVKPKWGKIRMPLKLKNGNPVGKPEAKLRKLK
ncbi:DUF1036 domain-containing protein [Ammoniphilus sp. 3BR4]|uniref:DUF1036 domain-containing protein n=1 Tax=Ammoniphilus sp. 3BR4 TaxID=3158265 RepID=UPI0034678E09